MQTSSSVQRENLFFSLVYRRAPKQARAVVCATCHASRGEQTGLRRATTCVSRSTSRSGSGPEGSLCNKVELVVAGAIFSFTRAAVSANEALFSAP